MREKEVVRPFRPSDAMQLDALRLLFKAASLEVPHGYVGPATETAVAEHDGSVVGSLTMSIVALLDPFIHDQKRPRLELMRALQRLENVLEYKARELGANDVYTAVPDDMYEYIDMLKRRGYKEAKGVTVLRRPLTPVTGVPSRELKKRAVALVHELGEDALETEAVDILPEGLFSEGNTEEAGHEAAEHDILAR